MKKKEFVHEEPLYNPSPKADLDRDAEVEFNLKEEDGEYHCDDPSCPCHGRKIGKGIT